MPKRRIIFVSVVCLSIAVFSVRTLSQTDNANRTATTPGPESSQFNKKIAESLNVRWSSIVYEKTLYNPALTSNKRGPLRAESLSISCQIEMPDSELVLTTCPDAVIEQITDSRGSNIEIDPLSSRSISMYIHNPQRGLMPAGRPSGPEHSTLKVELDAGLREQISGEIGLKGHFYALIAESLEYIELPFEPNDNWVSVTPDVEIRVREARNEASMYRFEIEQRPEIVPALIGLRIGDSLPSQLVVGRQIIVQTSAMGSGGGSSGGTIGGQGSGTGRAEKIRYTIAVNPAHQKIPFELEQIDLSVLAEPVPSRAHSSNQTEINPFKRMPEQAEPQFDKKVADCFEVKWSSIAYNKTLYNPAVSTNSKDQRVSEDLTLRCVAEIIDPKLVVGTSDIPVIEQITDGNGRDTDISRAQSRSNRMYYSTLRYGMKFSPPSMLIQWEGKVRKTLGLPLLARHRQPKRGLELQPVRLSIQLDPGLLRQDPGEIGSIKGYFHALTSKSLKHVKVPFESSDKWVRLTADVEIQIPNVRQTGSISRYEIRQRGQTGRRAFRMYVGDRLPGEIVVDRQFIGADGQSSSLGSRGGRPLPGNISGSGSIGGRQVDKIDFQIAVSPTYYKIPFEIEHIPLPEP
ncbi:MAG TPA: hypothetical protein VMX36_03915 [Sedimentisphaerales bacterium]|nr:hypothetical protein [Sedimentisphaerales bacterium]